MDSSRPHRVGGDSRSCPNSRASVDGRQASHAPPMNDQGQATGGAMDILLLRNCKEHRNRLQLFLNGQP